MPRTAAEDTRARILDAAHRLFYAHGVQAVGIARVAEEAGCGKNLLYREFPSKDALVAAYLRAFAERRAVATTAALAPYDGDPAGALVALAREVGDRLRERAFQGCAFRNYLREIRAYDDEPGRVATRWIADARQQVDDLAGRLDVTDPTDVGERVWLVLEGLYASVPYPGRARAGDAAVALVEELVGNAR
ncbi:MAG: putative TetR-family transcriptional regulator [Nocardioidaceae bacterium]|nr:putative TetR-family transcriptional regulator [Nocardioidaceae bacterium]